MVKDIEQLKNIFLLFVFLKNSLFSYIFYLCLCIYLLFLKRLDCFFSWYAAFFFSLYILESIPLPGIYLVNLFPILLCWKTYILESAFWEFVASPTSSLLCVVVCGWRCDLLMSCFSLPAPTVPLPGVVDIPCGIISQHRIFCKKKSHSVGPFFTQVMLSFAVQMPFSFRRFHSLVVNTCAIGVLCVKCFPVPIIWRVFPSFFSNTVKVSDLWIPGPT